ncbi:glycoside hydrolase family 72 protein [Hypoxylon sp. CI-4A]|nr:glycoside hydrolase family 72 protein [Hypoxylon sp. CI-4A]
MKLETFKPVEVEGRFFYKGDKRFLIHGVAYGIPNAKGEMSLLDPLSDNQINYLEACIPFFKWLRINCIFVARIDPTQHHSKAMSMLADAGIHVLVSIEAAFKSSVSPESWLATEVEYNEKSWYFRIVASMSTYPNTLGFAISRESDNHHGLNEATRFAVGRIKHYIAQLAAQNKQRIIPVGVIASRIPDTLEDQMKMLTKPKCPPGDTDPIDFFGFSGMFYFNTAVKYTKLVDCDGECFVDEPDCIDMAHGLGESTVPIFLTEYGNSQVRPRRFIGTWHIFMHSKLRTVFSGAFLDFFETTTKQGLVYLKKDDKGDESIEPLRDFAYLEEMVEVISERIPARNSMSLDHGEVQNVSN